MPSKSGLASKAPVTDTANFRLKPLSHVPLRHCQHSA